MTALTVEAIEESTYVVTAVLTDENGDTVVPTALTWSLYDEKGRVVNEREGVILTPASTVQIVVSGSDLSLSGDNDETRFLLLEGTYNSDLGGGLPIRAQAEFPVNHTIA